MFASRVSRVAAVHVEKLSAAAAAADGRSPAPHMLLKGGAHSSASDVVMEKWPPTEVMLNASVE